MAERADVIVVGAGLAGLVAACEAVAAGRRVLVVDQAGEANLGGQAHWSFGGLFLVDSPEQRRLGIRDSADVALDDWLATAGFDRPEDEWPRRWAEAYVDFAAGQKRAWLRSLGVKSFPVVGWAERGAGDAAGPGNSVPRFHVTWGTGPGVLEPFIRAARAAEESGRLRFAFRHRVAALMYDGDASSHAPLAHTRVAGAGEGAIRRVVGVRGAVLAPSAAERGREESTAVVGEFEFAADAVVVASGGIGANQELVRSAWPAGLGSAPGDMLTGVPSYVDGSMVSVVAESGARLINGDRMWHYTEGIKNWDPIWPGHGIRILPGPSSLWLDAFGERLPFPNYPGFDTLGTLRHLRGVGEDYSWFVLTRKIIEKEFALSGSEQNPDLTGKSVRDVLGRATSGVPAPVQAFLDHGEDFVSASTVAQLAAGMNAIAGNERIDAGALQDLIAARDAQLDNGFGKDAQLAMIRGARAYLGDKLIRTAAPHRFLDPKNGPLIAVRLRTLTRKTLGGFETNLDAQLLDHAGAPIPGLFGAGEITGFGGGGMHGYRALEGTFLGGALFSGRAAGRAAAR